MKQSIVIESNATEKKAPFIIEHLPVLAVLFNMFILLVVILAGCATYDCRHVAVDSYNKAVLQGQESRIVVGKMWPSVHARSWQQYHAEAQVLVNGEWCFLDNSTGQPLTGWYGKLVEPGMYISRVYGSVEEFKKDQMME